MSLCGCSQPCTCMLNVQPPDLITLTGDGDPLTGGWLITALETAFSLSNSDGCIDIIPGGPYGHAPEINLIVEDSSTVNLTAGPTGLRADIAVVPSGSGGVPPGTILDYAGQLAPAGYLLCYGQLEDIADYPDLFAAIGHAGNLGVDPGGAQFRIPDLRGRVTAGLDNMGGVDAGRLTVANQMCGVGGSEAASLGVANLPAHDHTLSDPGHTHNGATSLEGAHTHTPGSGDRSFITAVSADLTNVAVNSTSPDNVTRWVAGASGGPTVQQLDLGVDHSIVVSGSPTPDFANSGTQLNNATTSSAGTHSHTFTTDPSNSNVSVNVSGGNGGPLGNAFFILQPFMLVNKIIKT